MAPTDAYPGTLCSFDAYDAYPGTLCSFDAPCSRRERLVVAHLARVVVEGVAYHVTQRLPSRSGYGLEIGLPKRVVRRQNWHAMELGAGVVQAGAEVEAMSVVQFRAFVDGESSKYLRIINETGQY